MIDILDHSHRGDSPRLIRGCVQDTSHIYFLAIGRDPAFNANVFYEKPFRDLQIKLTFRKNLAFDTNFKRK